MKIKIKKEPCKIYYYGWFTWTTGCLYKPAFFLA